MNEEPLVIHLEEDSEMKKYKRYVCIFDVHAPFHDQKVCSAFLSFLKDYQPDGFVIGGDFIDMYSISRHLKGIRDLEDNSGQIIKLQKEFEIANRILYQFNDVLPSHCEKFYIEGNHENRLERWFGNDLNGVLDGLISVQQNLHLNEMGIKYIGDYPRSHIELGKLTVTHGEWSSMHVAKKHLDEYRQSVMFGHAHTAQKFYAGGLNIKQGSYCVGCMCDPKSKGMRYAKPTSRWVQGWAMVTVETKTGIFWVELVDGYDKKFFVNGKPY